MRKRKCPPPVRTECREMVDRIAAVVFGNGHPEHSLLTRMERVESKLCAIHRLAWVTMLGIGGIGAKLIVTAIENALRD